MASARKTFNANKPSNKNEVLLQQFIESVVRGEIDASNLVITRNPQGRITKIEYDDPSG